MTSDILYADWPAPDNIRALVTSRTKGVSEAPYDQFNLAQHVGDCEKSVNENRRMLIQQCPGLERIQWLNQTHGTEVVEANTGKIIDADASFTQKEGIACAILTADCLPIVICDRDGIQVAAIHAGWRGLAMGIVERTVTHFSMPARDLLVWFGPAISQSKFEVGQDVLNVFLGQSTPLIKKKINAAFSPSLNRPEHYFADLYQIARVKMNALGINKIYGGHWCSYSDPSQFYSYRRDGVTGRTATLIYKTPL